MFHSRLRIVVARHEQLVDAWFGACCIVAQHTAVHRHMAHMHQAQTFVGECAPNDVHKGAGIGIVARQKHHAHAVTPFFGHGNAVQQNKFVGNLYHDAGAVARFGVGTFGTAVRHVFEHCQGFIDNIVRFDAVDVHNQTNAASIVFVCGIVKQTIFHTENP